ncbi:MULTISPECIES: LamG domain-containing protein [unclassified Streptomyces]|uniref:LamG domain-containing protein n=1 Tax=unclassified Streptomyces TaxID=2593676 RepID=UPI0001C18AA2|nr:MULTISPECIES: LamG domain-containing protein [unclassified Streptomyces]AEN12953.1 Laminin G sub domain 2 [Streptomyces sp. SirexAA-E]PZX36409.1 concanavalin A-like lectin/glucanase superfamily protein [Streptomyces sp. DvalAA-21]RAJ31378.1 concanavalin A-like lectin/glucanase superfamily protein [Streptomyces sp. DpondAA-E10]RAJ46546.1 concanavalin A-like lectin/glucanase superfamily protein [Streptomyces sp. DpondAA-A50]SCD89291.1 Concanavalin A-like lectin/glucanases superfamily protein 
MNVTTGRGPSGGRGRVRAAATALCLFAGALTATATGGTPSAAALTPPVAITADDLTTWQTNGIVWSMAAGDGVVYAGGTFSTLRPPGAAAGTSEQPALNFAAFDAATGSPTGCSLSFTLSSGTATVRALALSPDGKTLYAGGQFGSVNGEGVSNIAAVDTATCTPRKDFKISVSATVRAIDVTANTVYFGGDFNSVGGQTRKKFAAVTTGAALLPFTADADEVARAVQVTPDGRHVALGGDFFKVNGTSSHALAVVDATTGALVKSYPGFIPDTSTVQDLTTDATGLYTANEGTGGGVFDGRIAIDLAGYQQRWRDTCLGATQAVLVHSGVLYSGSHAHDCADMGEFPDQPRKHLLAQSVDDPELLPWFPDTNDGIGEPVGPRVMSQTDRGGHHYLWVGGEFTTVNGVRQQGLTRFADGPDTGAPWVPNVSLSTLTPGRIDVNWQTSFDTDDGELTYRIYKDGASTPVHTTTGYSVFWDRPQLRWTDTAVAAGETHSYRITASDGTNTSAKSPAQSATVSATAERYPARVLSDGASVYWRYDEGTSTFAADATGNRNNGFLRNAPAYRQTPAAVAGSSTAIGFDGTSQYAYGNTLHPAPTRFSVETWIRTTTTRGGKVIGFGNLTMQNSTRYDKHVYMADNGRLVFGVYSGGYRTVTTTAAYNDGNWHHVVATQGTGGMALYVDGQLRASSSAYTASQNTPGYWRVGGDNLANWPNRPTSNFFAGQIDETAVYPTALSASQVSAHYALRTG